MNNRSRLKNFCFTLNNYDDSSYSSVLKFCESDFVSYAIVGKEIGEEKKTPHLQGYVEMSKQKSFKQVKFFIPGAHVEKRKGTSLQASDYCKKDNNYVEFGVLSSPGKRNDIVEFVKAATEGATDLDLITSYPSSYVKYGKMLSNIRNVVRTEDAMVYLSSSFSESKLKDWQAAALETLNAQSDRELLWVYDVSGGAGKSWMAKYLMVNYHAFVCTGGKKSDVAHSYDCQDYVVFDFSRTVEDYVSYDVIECFKNGILFSSKYESNVKVFRPPKVVVFANFKPKMSAMTSDRWHIQDLGAYDLPLSPPVLFRT